MKGKLEVLGQLGLHCQTPKSWSQVWTHYLHLFLPLYLVFLRCSSPEFMFLQCVPEMCELLPTYDSTLLGFTLKQGSLAAARTHRFQNVLMVWMARISQRLLCLNTPPVCGVLWGYGGNLLDMGSWVEGIHTWEQGLEGTGHLYFLSADLMQLSHCDGHEGHSWLSGSTTPCKLWTTIDPSPLGLFLIGIWSQWQSKRSI